MVVRPVNTNIYDVVSNIITWHQIEKEKKKKKKKKK